MGNAQSANMARPTIRSAQHRSTVGLILLLGTCFSFLTWHYLSKQEAERIQSGFMSRAQTQATIATQRLHSHEEMIYSLRDTFLSQSDVTREEFARAAKALLARHTGVQALQWVQIVPREQRAAFEHQVSGELGRPFEIRRRQPDNTMQRAPEDAEYWVVNYLEPLAGNDVVFGYDLRSSPAAPLLSEARADRQFKVSQPFRLVQSRDEAAEPGVTFILPFARSDSADNPVEGFVQGVFLVQTMLAQSHKLTANEALDSYYVDLHPGQGQPTLLYANLAGEEPLRIPGTTIALPPFDDPADLQVPIKMGNREWRLVIRKNAAWSRHLTSFQPEYIFGSGLTITVLLALFINALLQRTNSIEKEVQERTRQLRASETRLQAIIDHSPAFITLKDLEGRYLICNQPFANICQRPHDDVLGQRDEDLFPAAEAAVYREHDTQVLTTGRPMAFEESAASPTGLRTRIVQKFPLRDEQGRIYALCGIATDITERKKAEREKLAFERNLLETQKLESLGVLAGGIAHDFNNILTAVLGNASLARMGLAPADPSQDNLARIEKAANRAAALCNQMLTYAGKSQTSTGPVDLTTLVRDTTAMLKVSIHKNCELILNLANSAPQVLGDAAQLSQIVMNLVINASDAIGERSDGKINVTTFTQQADAALLQTALKRPNLPAGSYTGLEVRDNGCGMNPETLARIFDPFFTTKFTGRGLGLSAVLGIVQGHRGALFVESQPGVGTVFRLLLPTASHATGNKSAEKSADARQELRGTVLVVDDEEDVLQVSGAVLQRHGATVLLAADGHKALEIFQQQRDQIDLILVDLTMPGITGEELLRRLQQLGARQKIVVMSGYSEEETMQRCTALGAAGFLRKPFELQTIVAKLKPLLG